MFETNLQPYRPPKNATFNPYFNMKLTPPNMQKSNKTEALTDKGRRFLFGSFSLSAFFLPKVRVIERLNKHVSIDVQFKPFDRR